MHAFEYADVNHHADCPLTTFILFLYTANGSQSLWRLASLLLFVLSSLFTVVVLRVFFLFYFPGERVPSVPNRRPVRILLFTSLCYTF